MTKPSAKQRRITIRLTGEEYAALSQQAKQWPLAAYVRKVLFDGGSLTGGFGKASSVRPSKKELAQLLALFGQAVSLRDIRAMAEASRNGSLHVTPEVEAKIDDALATLIEIKSLLMTALGTKER